MHLPSSSSVLIAKTKQMHGEFKGQSRGPGRGLLFPLLKGITHARADGRDKENLPAKKHSRLPSWEPGAFGHQIDINTVFKEERGPQDPNWQGLN